MRALGGSLRTITTKVSLFLASETLACFHELRSLICVNPSGSCAAGCDVHGIGVITLLVVPSRFHCSGVCGFLRASGLEFPVFMPNVLWNDVWTLTIWI